jgi:hypothetical protein
VRVIALLVNIEFRRLVLQVGANYPAVVLAAAPCLQLLAAALVLH